MMMDIVVKLNRIGDKLSDDIQQIIDEGIIEIVALRTQVAELQSLKDCKDESCFICNGDCSSAPSPIIGCPKASDVKAPVGEVVGYISQEALNNLRNEEWQVLRNVFERVWTINSPPNRAIIPIYIATKDIKIVASPPAPQSDYVLVPREPTEAMVQAGGILLSQGAEYRPELSWADESILTYKAMLAAYEQGKV